MKKLLLCVLIVSLSVMIFAACSAQIDITVNGDSTSSTAAVTTPAVDDSSTVSSSLTSDTSSDAAVTLPTPVTDDPDAGWGPMIPLG